MEQESRTDQLITKYFFSELSDEERRQLEERYFTDSEFLNRMHAVEAELLEDYLHGTLSKETAAKLEEHMLRSPHQQHKLAFTDSILRAAAKQSVDTEVPTEKVRKRGALPPLLHGYFSLPAAAVVVAAVIVFCGAAWVVLEVNRLRREVGELEREQTAARLREQELHQTIARLEQSKTNNNQQEKENNLDDPRNAQERRSPSQVPTGESDAAVATLLLSPTSSRSGQELPKQIEILKNTRAVQLQLVYDGANAVNYQAVVETADGDVLLVKSDLDGERSGQKQIVKLEIPANLLTTRTYVLTLRSSSGADLSRYTFSVTKK